MRAQLLSRVHAEHVWRADHLRFTRDTVRALYTRLEELLTMYPGEILRARGATLIAQTYSIHLHTCISCSLTLITPAARVSVMHDGKLKLMNCLREICSTHYTSKT
jgi:hypothetical protein